MGRIALAILLQHSSSQPIGKNTLKLLLMQAAFIHPFDERSSSVSFICECHNDVQKILFSGVVLELNKSRFKWMYKNITVCGRR
jgi:hypothetical protein